MKVKVVPMREYPQEIEETVQKINKCLNISLFDWQIGYIFYNKPLPKEISFARRAGKTLAAALRMCLSKAGPICLREPICLRRRDIVLEGTETHKVLSYFGDEDVANKCRMNIFYETAKEVYFSLKNIDVELREIIFE